MVTIKDKLRLSHVIFAMLLFAILLVLIIISDWLVYFIRLLKIQCLDSPLSTIKKLPSQQLTFLSTGANIIRGRPKSMSCKFRFFLITKKLILKLIFNFN